MHWTHSSKKYNTLQKIVLKNWNGCRHLLALSGNKKKQFQRYFDPKARNGEKIIGQKFRKRNQKNLSKIHQKSSQIGSS